MEQSAHRMQEIASADGRISERMAKIAELKELLRHAHDIPEEMSLLTDLTQEISALRELCEPRYH